MPEKIERLFLDDYRPCPVGWGIARSYSQFKRIIETFGVPRVISFDHDLGWEHYAEANAAEIDYTKFTEKTGYDCAQLLLERGEYPELAIVHSFNPAGALNIANLLSPFTVVSVNPWRKENYV